MSRVIINLENRKTSDARRLTFNLTDKIDLQTGDICASLSSLAVNKKLSFPLLISSLNVTRFAENCGLRHIY